jgi:hypothetical protein
LLRFARNDSENRGDERSSRVPPIVLRAGLCVPVALDYRWRPVAADPDDDIVVETAVNGGSDVIATFNIDDMRAGAARFGIAAERPAAVLQRYGLNSLPSTRE